MNSSFLLKSLVVITLLSIGMVGSFALGAFFGVPYMREAGFSFLVAGIAFMVYLIYKIRRMFSDFSGERTWKSYR